MAAAAERADRDPAAVELLPVTKGRPVDVIEALREAGCPAIGENRVLEAEQKQAAFAGRGGIRWHMIGRLQRNKGRRAIGVFDELESVDSLKLASHLSRVALEEGLGPVGILVQVNTSGEEAKTGLTPGRAVAGIAEICVLPGLRVNGLMTMAPFTPSETDLRLAFGRARQLFDRCAAEVPGFGGHVLSMGMSNDFEIAIEEGSTRVRLGTLLLGEP
jgi:hypothetical protein